MKDYIQICPNCGCKLYIMELGEHYLLYGRCPKCDLVFDRDSICDTIQKDQKMYPISEKGIHMTITDFLLGVLNKVLTNERGYARYAAEFEMTEITITLEDVLNGKIDTTYTHVVWFWYSRLF